jgi:short-subunit dehydrogenase
MGARARELAVVTGASSGILIRAAQRVERYWRHGDLPDAGRDRDGILQTRRHDGHEVGTAEKDDPAYVAKIGFEAMLKGEGDVVSGWKNKLQSAVANVTPAGMLSEQHRKMAEPGSAKF